MATNKYTRTNGSGDLATAESMQRVPSSATDAMKHLLTGTFGGTVGREGLFATGGSNINKSQNVNNNTDASNRRNYQDNVAQNNIMEASDRLNGAAESPLNDTRQKEAPQMKGNKVPYNVVALAPNYVVDQLISRVAGNVSIVASAQPGEAVSNKAKMKQRLATQALEEKKRLEDLALRAKNGELAPDTSVSLTGKKRTAQQRRFDRLMGINNGEGNNSSSNKTAPAQQNNKNVNNNSDAECDENNENKNTERSEYNNTPSTTMNAALVQNNNTNNNSPQANGAIPTTGASFKDNIHSASSHVKEDAEKATSKEDDNNNNNNNNSNNVESPARNMDNGDNNNNDGSNSNQNEGGTSPGQNILNTHKSNNRRDETTRSRSPSKAAKSSTTLTAAKAKNLASPSVINHFYEYSGIHKPNVFQNLVNHGRPDVFNLVPSSLSGNVRRGDSSSLKDGGGEGGVRTGSDNLNDTGNLKSTGGDAVKRNQIEEAKQKREEMNARSKACDDSSAAKEGSTKTGNDDPNSLANGEAGPGSASFTSKSKKKEYERSFENEYIKHQMLGRGSFGETWLVEWVGQPGPYGEEPIIPSAYSALACTKPSIKLPDGKSIPADRGFVAKIEAKSMAKKKGQGGNAAGAEERILGNCAHPCIVAYVEEFDDKQYHYLIMEYVDGGDLRQEVQRRSETENVKYFSETSLLFLFVQIVMAVEYLHRYNVLHRDLKSANVLLSKKWLVKLADFGFAKQFDLQDVDHGVSTTSLGTPFYMPPELFKRETYSDKADMWSLGCILYELITLRRPFDGESVQDLANAVLHEDYQELQRDNISDELVALLDALLDKDPAERPSAKQVLQSAIMRNAMDEFIGKFSRAANASNSSALDKSWIKVLQEHQKILLADTLSSPKSRVAMSRMRSIAMSSRMMSTASRGGGASSRAHRSGSDDEDDSYSD